jgi:hypothetical protein
MWNNQFDYSHVWGHFVATVAIIGTFAGYLPYAAATAAFIWYILQIWESPVVQKLRPRPTPLERERRIALLVASAKVISAEIVALQLVVEAKATAADLLSTAETVAKDLKDATGNIIRVAPAIPAH